MSRFEVVTDRQSYLARQCWRASVLDLAHPLLTAAYEEFRVPLDLRVPELFLLLDDYGHRLLWVWEGFEGGSNDDMTELSRLVNRMATLSAGRAANLELLDRTCEVMIVEVVAPLPEVVEHLTRHASLCAAANDA